MSKKQSSIEWFLNEFSKQIEFVPESELDKWYKDLIPKAKAMHKEEIEEAYGHGQNNGYMYAHQEAITMSKENYFNQTFGGQDDE